MLAVAVSPPPEEDELGELDAVVAAVVDELSAEPVTSPVVVDAVSQAANNAVAANNVNKRLIIFFDLQLVGPPASDGNFGF